MYIYWPHFYRLSVASCKIQFVTFLYWKSQIFIMYIISDKPSKTYFFLNSFRSIASIYWPHHLPLIRCFLQDFIHNIILLEIPNIYHISFLKTHTLFLMKKFAYQKLNHIHTLTARLTAQLQLNSTSILTTTILKTC